MKAMLGTSLITASVVLAVSAWAGPPPADKCEAAKNKVAGKYAACRQAAEAKAVLKAVAADFTKCDSAFSGKWQKAEAKAMHAMATCPSMGDEMAIESFIGAHSATVAAALDGGALPQDAITCNANLTTCNGGLGTCNTTLSTCNSNLSTANATLATSNTNLATCNGSLGTCNASLSTCSTNLTSCSGSLGTCNTSLTTCNSDLSAANATLASANANLTACSGNLSTCNGSLTTCSSDLSTANGNLAACNGNLGTCNSNLSACLAGCVPQPNGQPLKTGQTLCYTTPGAVIPCAGTGQDGELQQGLTRQYTDNGDGTITDNRTGLMWEKLSRDGTIHDYTTTYTWANAFTKIANLNTANYAGHNDWRLPNANQLPTIIKRGAVFPPVDAIFNSACVLSCTVTACSCTGSSFFWSSTTYLGGLNYGWGGDFNTGAVYANPKNTGYAVRAVRGGS